MAQAIPARPGISGNAEPSHASAASAVDRVRRAQVVLRQNRAQGLAMLNALFREGKPKLPDGRCSGELVALNIAPGLTQLFTWLLGRWLPWKGKTFDPVKLRGDNIFIRSAFGLSHVLFPFYRGYVDDTAKTYRAFAFRTYMGPGKEDPDLEVLKIDYDSPDNPALSVRRVLDELVEIGDGYYLGKAHLQWLWGTWQMVAFFALKQPEDSW